jgi:hypothetical protein
MSKRWSGISLLLGVILIVLAINSTPVDAEALLGIPLPASATNIQISLKRDLLSFITGDFQGYVRFELSPQDAQALLKMPEFQNVQQTVYPQGIMGNAVSGSTPVGELALQNHPRWWIPESGGNFLVGYRSFQPSPVAQQGVDFAWYMIDLSDPAKAVAYVYVLEV